MTVPPQTSQVDITYVPRRFVAPTWMSNLTLLISLIAFSAASLRRTSFSRIVSSGGAVW